MSETTSEFEVTEPRPTSPPTEVARTEVEVVDPVDADEVDETVDHPAKVMRIGAMMKQLLEELRASEAGQHVCWPEVEALQDFGGIRIEDNVAIRPDGVENLTRDAFAQAPGAA